MNNIEYNFTFRKKNGKTQVILSYKDTKGRWRQKSKQGFDTKQAAKIAGNKLLDQIKEDKLFILDESAMGITLSEVFDLFLKENENILEYNSQDVYRSALAAFADIADKPIRKITRMEIINCLSKVEYTVTTKNIYKNKLNVIFKYAINSCKLLTVNPINGMAVEKDKRFLDTNLLSSDEFLGLLQFAKGRNKTAYIKIAIAGYAGLRYGEILGLTWDSINFKNRELTVDKQLAQIGENKYGLKATKSMNGYRTVPIPVALIEVLKEYRCSVPIRIDGRLFGERMSCSSPINRLIHKSKYQKVTIHSLRHTYATRLLANGVDVKTVAALLGDTIETVLKTYVHYSDEMRKNAKENIDKIFA